MRDSNRDARELVAGHAEPVDGRREGEKPDRERDHGEQRVVRAHVALIEELVVPDIALAARLVLSNEVSSTGAKNKDPEKTEEE